MKIFTTALLTCVALCAVIPAVTGQTLPRQVTEKIDSLFHPWNKTSSPGWAVGVVRNDSLIFAKGYGMADLEYGLPITAQTIFRMASVSKQFTAYAILLLERQGKLRLDDDIHKYLAWFPDLKETITIRNLLNHTSGLRDQWELLAIAGTRLDDVITQEQVLKILSKQQALNFKPGTDWSYSNSGYTLLGEIVRSVSGQTLRQFTDSAIFKPLGMKNTHFQDDYAEIIPNRAYSYTTIKKDHFSTRTPVCSNVGPTGLLSNIEDMSRWIMNFYHPLVGDENEIRELTDPVVVNGTKRRNYAKGIVADSIFGQRRFQHGGVEAGYQTFVSVFPDLKMGFIVFSNLGDVKSQRFNEQLASLFIKDVATRKERPSSRRDSALAILTSADSLRNYAGDYIADDATRFRFRIKDQKFFVIAPDGKYYLLIATGPEYQLFSDTTLRFVFSGAGMGHPIIEEYWPVGNHLRFEKYDTAARTEQQLKSYAGTYYSPELDCIYRIVLKDHHLFLTNAKYNDSPLTLYGDDHLLDDFWWMNHIHILRGSKKEIVGFELNGNRTMHLKFVKTLAQSAP